MPAAQEETNFADLVEIAKVTKIKGRITDAGALTGSGDFASVRPVLEDTMRPFLRESKREIGEGGCGKSADGM